VTINDEFPADGGPLAEHQMIGRGPILNDLERRLRDANKLNLLEPRRTGKSSVAGAAVDRVRQTGGLAASVDLAQIPEPARVRETLATQLAAPLAALAHTEGSASGWLAKLDGDDLEAQVHEKLAKADSPGETLRVVASAVEPGTTALLLDEVHVVKEWPNPQQRSIREFLRNDSSLGVILASSEMTAFEQLIGAGMILEFVGQRYPLPPINLDDWIAGLRTRFARVGLPIDDDALERLLEASQGHPYCTMFLARDVAYSGKDIGRVTNTVVRGSLVRVEADRGWRTLRDAC
jgi:hypothetical protein